MADQAPSARSRPRASSAVRGAAGRVRRTIRTRLEEPAPSQWVDVAEGSTDEEQQVTVTVRTPEVDPGPSAAVSGPVKVAAAWSWRLLVIAAAIYLIGHALQAVPVVTIPFVVALLLTSVLAPVRGFFHDQARLPHSLASFAALLVGIATIGVVATFVAMQVQGHAPELVRQFSQFLDDASVWLRNGPLHLSDRQVQNALDEAQATLTKNQDTLVSGVVSTARGLSEVIAGGLLMLLATFFLLRDGDKIWRWVLSLLPGLHRARVDQMGRVGWHTLAGYMRGVSIIALLHAVTVFLVLVALRVPMATALSVLIFVASFIPMIGMTVAGSFCVVVSLIEHGPAAALVVALTILALIQLEAHLLQPLIMSRNVEVHPLGVAMSVLVGTTIAGIPGALFSVPLVAFANAVMRARHLPLSESGIEGEHRPPEHDSGVVQPTLPVD